MATELSPVGTPLCATREEAEHLFCLALVKEIDASGLVPAGTYKVPGKTRVYGPHDAYFEPICHRADPYSFSKEKAPTWVEAVKVSIQGRYRRYPGYHARLVVKDGTCNWKSALAQLSKVIERWNQSLAMKEQADKIEVQAYKQILASLTAAGIKLDPFSPRSSAFYQGTKCIFQVRFGKAYTEVKAYIPPEKAAEFLKLIEEFTDKVKSLGGDAG